MDRFKVDLRKDDILKGLLIFAVPMLISNVFQQLYNTIDTAIVGNFLGDASLAAMGASGPVFELLVGFALGVGNGLSVVVARNFGSNDEDLIKKSVFGSLIVGLVLTIILMIFAQFGLYPLLKLLDTPVNIIDESFSYIYVITISVGVLFLYNLCAGFLRATGDSVMPLVFLIISSVFNVLLDLLFITKMGMGVEGAAIATVISQGISVVLSVFYIYQKAKVLIPEKQHFDVELDLYKELVGQGLSMGLMIAIVSTGTVILQKAINGFGHLTIAGHSIARKVGSFFSMPGATLSAALSTFVSQNRGADQRERIQEGVKTGNKLAIGWGLLATVLVFLFGKQLIVLMSGSTEVEVINTATRYLRFNAPFYGILGVLLNLRSSLQGLGQKLVPLVSSIIEFIAKILFAWLLIPKLGYFGVIICEPVIWCLMCTQLFFAFYRDPYIVGEEDK